MTKERRLGRGLEALLGRLPDGYADDTNTAAPAATGGPGQQTSSSPMEISVYEVDGNPFQPRRDFEEPELAALADSLKQHGLLQPIAVRKVGDRYQLIAGERRLRAAIKAGWQRVPAHLIEADDRQVAELAIIENLQRQDLNPLEKAASFQQYLERYGCTQEELAGRLQLDRSTVSNLIRLLELPDAVQQAVRRGAISQGHARALLSLGDEREQTELCQRIQAEGLSVRAIESIVQHAVSQSEREELGIASEDDADSTDSSSRPKRKPSSELTVLEQELRGALGTKVEIRTGARGRGKIIVHFTSHDEFERLRGHMHGSSARSRKAG